MSEDIRYEVNHNGEIVAHEAALSSDLDKILQELFSQYNWKCKIVNKEGSCRTLLLTDANKKTKTVYVYCGNIRNEKRSPYEKKIQLGTSSDPRKKSKDNTIILGVYVFNANDNIKDAIFVGYPIDDNIKYDTNPSIRGTFVNQLLVSAKTNGFVYDKSRNTVGFRAEFIHYYLDNYMNLHYTRQNEGVIEIVSTEFFSKEWFSSKAEEFPDFDATAEEIRQKFLSKYSVEYLESLNGKELLTSIFLNKESKENLCYELEFNNDLREFFGSIKSGTAYKYGLHYSQKNNSWATGSAMRPVFLTEDAAIDVGTKIRDYLVAGAKFVLDISELTSVNDYFELYKNLQDVTDGYIGNIWFLKYYQMLRPGLFPPIYSNTAQETVCDAIKVEKSDNALCRMAAIRFFANECNISNILFSKIFWTYITSITKEENVGNIDMTNESKQVYDFDADIRSEKENLIVYGTPGCGKSYHVKNTLLKDYETNNVVRTTFYPDYTNTDFVGQILPKVSGEDVTYKFNPGPFTLALEKAVRNPSKKIALVIEELNRGNAASIFGDIFQLLDREEGKSEYRITNVNIQDYLSEQIPEYIFEYIKIPANMCIIATMNTSDQNVFTLDTAFKRRWEFLKLKNTFIKTGDNKHTYREYYVPGIKENMTWEQFVTYINRYIVRKGSELSSEDKQLGVYFVSKDFLCQNPGEYDDSKVERFAYKVLEYLWDDVAKFNREYWFLNDIDSLDKLVEKYVENGKEVFNSDIFRESN